MRDILEWCSPLGLLGVIADKIAVERHMRNFVTRKQLALKEEAERRALRRGTDAGASDP